MEDIQTIMKTIDTKITGNNLISLKDKAELFRDIELLKLTLQSQKVTLEQAREKFESRIIEKWRDGITERHGEDAHEFFRGLYKLPALQKEWCDYLQALKDFNILEDGE